MPSPFDKDAILKGDVAQMRALFTAASPLAQLDRQYRISAELLVNTLLGGDQLDVVFAPLVARFKQQLIAKATHDSYFYTDPLHPLRRVLDCLLQHACYWYPRDTKQQSVLLQRYQCLIDEVALHSSVNSDGNWDGLGVFDDFNRWIDAESKRAEFLESRVCQAAVNHFKLLEAECSVLNLINNSFAGKRIPADAHSLIISALKSELQYDLINDGFDSSFWRSWSSMLPMIARIFHAGSNQADTQDSSAIIPTLLSDLQKSLTLSSSNPDNYQFLVSRLSELLSQAAQQSLNCIPFKALPNPEGYENFNSLNTRHVQTGIDEMQVGSWVIMLSDDGQKIRCKLALKSTNSNQLLFVDRSGCKVMVKSSEELLLCLNAGTVKRFTPRSFHDFFSHLLDKLIVQAKQLARKQKTKETAVQQAVHQKQKEVVQRNQLVEVKQKTTKQVEGAKEQAAALNIGAMVTICKEGHTSQRCKLAASIAATGKYIFTDSSGRKFAEYQYAQMIEAILDQKLLVISNGDIFEDQLAKVIRGSR